MERNDVSIETLWGYACIGNNQALKYYYENNGEVNRRYEKFGELHSLIMGAFRNGEFETVELLLRAGETVTEKERQEIQFELNRTTTMKKIIAWLK